MADTTNISWADATFNPWIGCMKTGSPACEGCYADALMGTAGRHKRATWGGPGLGVGTRVRTSNDNWKKPLAWERKQRARVAACKRGDAPKPAPFFVFCASLADVFDNAVPAGWRADLFELIRRTPHLTWLLLTKRPQNIAKMALQMAEADLGPYATDEGVRSWWPRNAAIGCTVVTPAEANRDLPWLLGAKAMLRPAFAFVSLEPMAEALSVWPWLGPHMVEGVEREGLDWVITGGGTDQGGWKAPPLHPDWVRAIRDQCAAHRVPFQHKQNGEYAPASALSHGFRSRGHHRFEDGTFVWRVGKKVAGRLLDYTVHDARPNVPLEIAA